MILYLDPHSVKHEGKEAHMESLTLLLPLFVSLLVSFANMLVDVFPSNGSSLA